MIPIHVAIIGAGMSGLSCAQVLASGGVEVTLFDKGRGPGGRMASTRSEQGPIDIGAQYFRTRDPRFQQQVKAWRRQGLLDHWHCRCFRADAQGLQPSPDHRERLVGTPRMSALTRALADRHRLITGNRIIALEHGADGWSLYDAENTAYGPFHHVVVAVPAHQAEPLLNHVPELADRAARVSMEPCWSVYIALEQPLATAAQAIYVSQGPLRWAACNSSKPARQTPQTWVLQATATWSRNHLEELPQQACEQLSRALFQLLGESAEIAASGAHRWLYAMTPTPLGQPYLLDAKQQLSACGDWCLGNNVESAWLSGHELGTALLAQWAKPA